MILKCRAFDLIPTDRINTWDKSRPNRFPSSPLKGRTTGGLFVAGFPFAPAAASDYRSVLPSIHPRSSRDIRKQCLLVSAQASMAIAPSAQPYEKISE
jgi:hypothetical protein